MFLTFVASVVALPEPIPTFIALVIAFVVNWLLTQIALAWPFLASYLGPYRDQVISGLSAYVLAWVAAQVNAIPAQYTDLTNAILNVIAIAIGLWLLPLLTFKYFQRKGLRSFRLSR